MRRGQPSVLNIVLFLAACSLCISDKSDSYISPAHYETILDTLHHRARDIEVTKHLDRKYSKKKYVIFRKTHTETYYIQHDTGIDTFVFTVE